MRLVVFHKILVKNNSISYHAKEGKLRDSFPLTIYFIFMVLPNIGKCKNLSSYNIFYWNKWKCK